VLFLFFSRLWLWRVRYAALLPQFVSSWSLLQRCCASWRLLAPLVDWWCLLPRVLLQAPTASMLLPLLSWVRPGRLLPEFCQHRRAMFLFLPWPGCCVGDCVRLLGFVFADGGGFVEKPAHRKSSVILSCLVVFLLLWPGLPSF
jgi:hypothetical protein